MSLQINNNSQNLLNTLQLNKTHTAMAKSLAKLATGQQILSSADDASGLTISDQLQSELLAFNQSIRNASDSISTVQLADGALDQATKIMQGVREKTLQAANASQSPESRLAIQNEINKSLDSLGGIIKNTTFNGRQVFGDLFPNLNLGSGASPSSPLAEKLSTNQDLTVAAGTQLAAGSVIKGGTTLTNDINGIGGQLFAAGQTLQGDIVTAGTNYLNKAMDLKAGSTLNAGSVLAASPQTTSDQGTSVAGLPQLDVTFQNGAQQALAATDSALNQIDNYRADLGSRQNQLTSTINNLSNSITNTAAAASKIGDVDLAEEALFFSQSKLLNKAQIFAATQTGKLNAANVMTLLQG